jgi:hypothetical protein
LVYKKNKKDLKMMPMMNGNGSINMMNVAINNAQDTDRILTEQEIMSAPDCIDSALKHGKRPADYCSDKSFKAFWGMTKEEAYEKNLEDARKILAGQKEEKIGSVFEKGEKLEEKAFTSDKKDIKSVTNNGIEPNAIDAIKRELSAQEKDIKGPSYEPSLNFVK